MELCNFRVIWEKDPKPFWLWNLRSLLEEGGPCRQVKFLSCPIKIHLPKTVVQCGRNSRRQSRLCAGCMCKRKTKENRREKKMHRKRGRKGRGGGERIRKRSHFKLKELQGKHKTPHIYTVHLKETERGNDGFRKPGCEQDQMPLITQ